MAITKIEVPELFDFGSDNSAFKLPTGTTAERPTSPSNGEMRFNTTTGYVEYYDTTDTQWWEIDYAPILSSDNFNTVAYAGNGGTQAITTGFTPDLVWTKQRSSPSRDHLLNDSVRGANKILYPNLSNSEDTAGGVGSAYFNSFDSNGFTVGSSNYYNGSSLDYVAWSWKAGGAAVSNTDGSITSQVSANVDAGFSISTFTSNASTLTVGHGLNSTPDLVIVKATSFSDSWFVNSSALTNQTDRALRLNESSAEETSNAFWNNTAPTSTTFSLGNGVSVSGQSYVAYSWHSVAGYSKIGSYTWTGTSYTAGTMVTGLGFEPSFVMIKGISLTSDWQMYDNKRVSGTQSYALYADLSDAEVTSGYQGIGFDSDGFSAIVGADGNTTASGGLNKNGETYIYMAFAAN